MGEFLPSPTSAYTKLLEQAQFDQHIVNLQDEDSSSNTPFLESLAFMNCDGYSTSIFTALPKPLMT